MIDISIVIPVYFNEGSIEKTFLRLRNEVFVKFPNLSFEVIFIDDGSRDGSGEEIMKVKNKYPENVVVIEFTRNFGQVSAICAGYANAQGKAIMNIAADMQEPTELLIALVDCYLNHEAPIIIGQRIGREETIYRKITSDIFYFFMRKLSFTDMPLGGFDVALIDEKVRDVILSLNDANPFWQGQILWTGYPIKVVPYERNQRLVGKSRWTFFKKVKYLLDGVLNYSYAPLRFFSLLGIISFFLGILYSIIIVIQYFFFKTPFNGWAPIMIVILLFSGVQLLMLGLIGEYMWRIFDQTKNKPKYMISKIIK